MSHQHLAFRIQHVVDGHDQIAKTLGFVRVARLHIAQGVCALRQQAQQHGLLPLRCDIPHKIDRLAVAENGDLVAVVCVRVR